MNIWGKKERSWRRKNRRGVSPIIATILLVAITVVLAAVLYILIQQYTKSGNAVTIGSALAIGGSADGSNAAGTILYYNMTVESTSTTLTFGSFTLEVKSPTGTLLIGSGGSVGGVAYSALVVKAVSPSNTVGWIWTPGVSSAAQATGCTAPAYTSACTSASLFSTQYFFSVQITQAANAGVSLSGATLTALGQGSYSGTTSGSIT
jgi:flagellin-like protein